MSKKFEESLKTFEEQRTRHQKSAQWEQEELERNQEKFRARVQGVIERVITPVFEKASKIVSNAGYYLEKGPPVTIYFFINYPEPYHYRISYIFDVEEITARLRKVSWKLDGEDSVENQQLLEAADQGILIEIDEIRPVKVEESVQDLMELIQKRLNNI